MFPLENLKYGFRDINLSKCREPALGHGHGGLGLKPRSEVTQPRPLVSVLPLSDESVVLA